MFWFYWDTLKVLRRATSTQKIEDKYLEIKRFHLHIRRMSNRVIPALPFCHVTLKTQKPLDPSYPKSLKTFGDHLKKRRLDLGLLQKEVAEKIGVDEASVHNWERNLTAPSLGLMPRVLEFLGYIPFQMETGSLGEKIKSYRWVLGLSQKALAKQLKIDPCTLARWEKGKGRPLKELLNSIHNLVESVKSNFKF
jgi:transcriptional regulator with XRE-family HTH domain